MVSGDNDFFSLITVDFCQNRYHGIEKGSVSRNRYQGRTNRYHWSNENRYQRKSLSLEVRYRYQQRKNSLSSFRKSLSRNRNQERSKSLSTNSEIIINTDKKL